MSKEKGVGILGLLGVSFVTLKLTGYIDWSWWLVTLPFWGGIALLVFVLGLIGLYFLIRVRGDKNKPSQDSKFNERMSEMMEKAEKQK